MKNTSTYQALIKPFLGTYRYTRPDGTTSETLLQVETSNCLEVVISDGRPVGVRLKAEYRDKGWKLEGRVVRDENGKETILQVSESTTRGRTESRDDEVEADTKKAKTRTKRARAKE